MDANEILARAKAGTDLPEGWVVFPLLRKKVVIGLVGWILGAILGFAMFALVSSIVIPYNYQRGIFSILFTTLLLGILLFIGVGSLWTFVNDLRRLRAAEKHIIVITPEDFVKQEGEKIVHVPIINIRYVTARGLPPPDRSLEEARSASQVPGAGENTLGFLLGRGNVPSGMRWRRRRMRTPTTLAFVDTRGDNEVLVVNDSSHGDPFAMAALLRRYADAKQRLAI